MKVSLFSSVIPSHTVESPQCWKSESAREEGGGGGGGGARVCGVCVSVWKSEWGREREKLQNLSRFPGDRSFLSTPVPRWLGPRAWRWVLALFILHERYRRRMSGAWLDSIVWNREIDSFRCFRANYDRISQCISNSPCMWVYRII